MLGTYIGVIAFFVLWHGGSDCHGARAPTA